MSLFDILRYQNTDLESQVQLSALPDDLIKLYWDEAHKYTGKEDYRDKSKMCFLLAVWAKSDGPTSPFAYKVFMETLKNYNL